MTETRTRNIAIVLYDGVEILDFAGPYEVFYAASRHEGRPFEVFTIADRPQLVQCSSGLFVKPHYTLTDHPQVDIVVVPGGRFQPQDESNGRLVEWIRRQAPAMEIVSSVCTGFAALAQAGILDGKRATTHWQAIEYMREHFPTVDVVAGERFVDAGNVVTAAGVSAGIDMALHLVERICGSDVAEEVARYMEYDRYARPLAGV